MEMKKHFTIAFDRNCTLDETIQELIQFWECVKDAQDNEERIEAQSLQ
jgi:hypothetical protein